MGTVYLAEDQKLHREVALKVLMKEFFDDSERLQRFQREAKTAAQISHPNVMAIYDIGTANDPETGEELQYIVMERVQGKPLGDYFLTDRPDMNGVVRIAEKIASGLKAAHALNIAHRDIKASNILVDDEGTPKILDFGLAKPIDPVQMDGEADSTDTISQELTRAGKIVGTVAYMSPEQARGEPVDVRTDIFSFGVLLYRMATGESPFSGKSQVSTLAKILESRHESPRVKNDQIPGELERIIDKCLQKDAADRYQSAGDLAVDLRSLRRQFDSGVTETISGEYARAQTFSVSGKKIVYAVIGVVLLSVVALLTLNVFDNPESEADQGAPAVGLETRAPSSNVLAVFNFENKTGDTTLAWLQTGLPEILLTDLAQSASITVISRERVADRLMVARGLPQDIEKELEESAEELQRLMKSEGMQDIPGVREAIRMARGRMANYGRGQFTHAEMVKAAGELGAGNVLSGSFYKLGDKIRIDARLEDVTTGQIVLAEKVVGENPLVLVDSLTAKIAASLDLTAETDESVASMMTDSPEAYRVYLDGMESFGLELFDEAIGKFERALEIDPGFALAYMRIGMANVFSGRMQQGAKYFALAQEHRDNLPIKERRLLDVYTDLWLDQQFDEAFVKLKSYARDYPADKEGRAFYGIATWVFKRDTAVAAAQYDTVLSMDPTYQLALSFYGQLMNDIENYDSAKALYKKMRAYHPESPEGYLQLSSIYLVEGNYDKAKEGYSLVTDLFPGQTSAWLSLEQIAIRQRNFDEARQYLDQYRQKIGDDPYDLNTYFLHRANLANWRGKFRDAIDHAHSSLEQAFLAGDSNEVQSAYGSLHNYYLRFDMKDSALWAIERMAEWTSELNRLDVVMRYPETAPEKCDSVRAVMDDGIEFAKGRVPQELWPLFEELRVTYNAMCANDSAAVVEALFRFVKAQQPGQGTGNKRTAAFYLIGMGEYQRGLEILEPYITGENATSSGFLYPYIAYQVGLAKEGLGKKDEAVEMYKEVLRYWGDADMSFKELDDARERLAKLTS